MQKIVTPAIKPNPYIMYFEQFDNSQFKMIKGLIINQRIIK